MAGPDLTAPLQRQRDSEVMTGLNWNRERASSVSSVVFLQDPSKASEILAEKNAAKESLSAVPLLRQQRAAEAVAAPCVVECSYLVVHVSLQ